MTSRGLTGPLDPHDDYALYWLVNFQNRPAIMKKEEYDNLGAKFRESLPLLRLITGSDVNTQVDAAWMSTLSRMTGPDGMLYAKKRDARPSFTLGGCGTGRIMGAMMVYHALDGNPEWLERVRRIVDRYTALATYPDDYAYFPRGHFLIGQTAEPAASMPIGIWAVDGVAGRIVQPLGQYYALTHYEPAKVLGDKLVNYLLYHAEFFGPDGQWLTDKLDPAQYPGREQDVHFGTHSHMLLYIETLQRRIYGEPLETVLGGVVYDTLIFRGDTLVRIDPPGRGYPLYLREHYREDEPRFRKVQRFVPAREIAY